MLDVRSSLTHRFVVLIVTGCFGVMKNDGFEIEVTVAVGGY